MVDIRLRPFRPLYYTVSSLPPPDIRMTFNSPIHQLVLLDKWIQLTRRPPTRPTQGFGRCVPPSACPPGRVVCEVAKQSDGATQARGCTEPIFRPHTT